MEARARSESGGGGGGAAAGPRGLQTARRGRAPAEGREEAVEAADGALRSLARMLPAGGGPVGRVQAGGLGGGQVRGEREVRDGRSQARRRRR
jgi:hypothetical protein